MDEHLGLGKRIKAYKLTSNVIVLCVLLVSTVVAVVVYWYSDRSGFLANLALAFGTSLLASTFVLISDSFVKFRTYENDIFLEGIEKLGISNLHFNKRVLLSRLMKDCERDFWAAGYRLILTASLAPEIEEAAKRNVSMKFLCTPPWEPGFQLVYGHEQRVMDNYLKVFDAVLRGAEGHPHTCQVRFTRKPQFSDTYRVDKKLVTGPYMHNEDPVHGQITANDFFTYELHRQSQLHSLIDREFDTLWRGAGCELNWERYRAVSDRIKREDLNDAQKQQLVLGACDQIGVEPAGPVRPDDPVPDAQSETETA